MIIMIEETKTEKSRIDESKFQDLLKSIRLNVTDSYSFPPEIIRIDGMTIATVGNFSASTGKPKSKKTFNVSAIVAAALSGKEVLKYRVDLPPGKQKVLYIDTEQSRYHCHLVLNRILKMAGMPLDADTDRIEFFVLREYSPELRRDIINCALRHDQTIGLVIIDGIRDLLRDINSPSESLDIINDLMRWSSRYELHIHTVLHLNKADDNTRGHVGTELNNKAETVLQITRCEGQPNMSEVKAMHIRDREFIPFAFSINEEGLPALVNDYDYKMSRKDRKMRFDELPEDFHRRALNAAFADGESVGYQQLMERLKSGYEAVGFVRGANTMGRLKQYLVSNGALVQNLLSKEYAYDPDFSLGEQSALL